MRTRAAIALLCLCLGGLSAQIRPSAPEGLHPEGLGLFFVCDSPGASLFYRFDGATSLRPLRDVLELTALPGEERNYLIHVEARTAEGLVDTSSFSYLIDRLPPAAPRAEKPSGLARPGERVALSAQAGTRIVYSLLPSTEGPQAYEGPVLLPGKKDEVIVYSLSAVALDAAGNASDPMTVSYTVPWGGLQAATAEAESRPEGEKPGAVPAPSLEAQATDRGRRLIMSAPGASSFRWAVLSSSGKAAGSPGPWQDAAAEAGKASLDIPVPPGWVGTISIIARAADASLALSPPSGAMALSFTDEGTERSEEGALASLKAVPGTRSAWFIAGSGPGFLRYRQDGGEELSYSGPVLLHAQDRATRIDLRWYRLLPEGRRSDERSLSLSLPPDPGKPAIEGLPSTGVSSNAITVRPSGRSIVLRYEITRMGAEPPPVTSSSPVMEGPLRYGAEAGQTVPYRIRVRSFSARDSQATMSDEVVYSFTVDRTPPSPPRLEEYPAPQGKTDKYFGFGEGPDEVYWRLWREAEPQGGWQPFRAPIKLEPSQDGPVSYSLSAYAVDLAGNRSAESERVTVTLDAGNVYAAEGGDDKADGSPTSPVHSLEMAIRIAKATGRSGIRLRGKIRQGADIVIDGDLSIEGGYGEDWKSDPRARASLPLRSLSLSSGKLSLARVDISSSGLSGLPFSRIRSGTLSMTDSSLSLLSSAEEVLAMEEGASAFLEGVSISIQASGKTTGFLVTGGTLELRSSSLSISGADIATALAVHGGRALLSQTRLSCSSSLSAAVIQAEGAEIGLSRSFLLAEASGGFSSCLMSREATIRAENCVLGSSRSMEAVIIDLSGGFLSLDQSTAFLRDSARVAIGIRVQGSQLEIRNCAFADFATAAQGALFDGHLDAKGIQSLWQGGFQSVMRSDPKNILPGRVYGAKASQMFGFDSKGLPRMESSSVLIDRGSPLSGVAEGDWYGNPRPSAYGKGLPDVGAFEYQ